MNPKIFFEKKIFVYRGKGVGSKVAGMKQRLSSFWLNLDPHFAPKRPNQIIPAEAF